MKIFLAFFQSKNRYDIPAYDFWQYYLKNGIEEAGHEWDECPEADWALGLVPKTAEEQLKWKLDTWEKTMAWLKKHPVDLFLSYLYPEQIHTVTIREIQKLGTPCVNFFCDHIRDFKKLPGEFSVFDLNWVPETKAIELYKKAGHPYINLPMPMWVDPKYRVLREETNHQVTFIGSMDIQRKLLFERILQKDPALPLCIYGNAWKQGDIPSPAKQTSGYSLSKKIRFNLDFIKREGLAAYSRKIQQRNFSTGKSSLLNANTYGPPLIEEYNTLTAESMITLGINRYPSYRFPLAKPASYSRLRDIEAPMLGACYLTEWTEGIDDLYNIENEINVYRSDDELIDKIKELEANPAKRKTLKINGQKKAMTAHTIQNSIKKIICSLGL